MTIKFFKKGDPVDSMSTAGADMYQYTEFGITADVFETEKGWEIPMIHSENPGSGRFPDFLEALKKEAKGKRIIINTVVNERIKSHFLRAGIEFN